MFCLGLQLQSGTDEAEQLATTPATPIPTTNRNPSPLLHAKKFSSSAPCIIYTIAGYNYSPATAKGELVPSCSFDVKMRRTFKQELSLQTWSPLENARGDGQNKQNDSTIPHFSRYSSSWTMQATMKAILLQCVCRWALSHSQVTLRIDSRTLTYQSNGTR